MYAVIRYSIFSLLLLMAVQYMTLSTCLMNSYSCIFCCCCWSLQLSGDDPDEDSVANSMYLTPIWMLSVLLMQDKAYPVLPYSEKLWQQKSMANFLYEDNRQTKLWRLKCRSFYCQSFTVATLWSYKGEWLGVNSWLKWPFAAVSWNADYSSKDY